MQVALIADDPRAVAIAAALRLSDRHRFVALVAHESVRDVLVRAAPGARMLADWQELLAVDVFDAVVVAAFGEELLDGARRLAGAGHPLLVVPLAGMGLAFVHELSLIRDDTGASLYPMLTRRFDPATLRLTAILHQQELNRRRLIRLVRRVGVRVSQESMQVFASDADVRSALLEDIDLIRFLGGEYNRVTAIHSGVRDAGFAEATVTLSGPDTPDAVLIYRAADEAAWTLEVECDSGRAVLSGTGEFDNPQLECSNELNILLPADKAENAVVQLLDSLEPTTQDRISNRTNWTDLTRAFEIVEATRESLRRRRTVDVYFEQTSERSLFKTQMAAVGCGVLSWTLAGSVLYLVIASAVKLPKVVLQIARGLWLLPLVVFIALQLLLLITKPAQTESRDRSRPSTGPPE